MDAASLTRRLGGIWRGHSGNAPCPVCQPERRRDQTGLSLRNVGGRLLAFCFKSACAFQDIAAAAGLAPGAVAPDPLARARAQRPTMQGQGERQALALWRDAATVRASGTLAERYLRGRGITCTLPESLRFHPSGWHQSGQRWPMMLARVDSAPGFALHRTYLAPTGGKAPVDPCKAMLGPCAGGAVRLAEAEGPLVVAEGIETGLALASGLLHGPATIVAALSTSGMRGLHLPPDPGRLTIASDGDTAGREAALALAQRACSLGWRVSLLPAPNGRDWADVLALKGGAA